MAFGETFNDDIFAPNYKPDSRKAPLQWENAIFKHIHCLYDILSQ